MTQDELIIPGQFLALPRWLAAIPNKTLPASAKLVAAAIANRLGRNHEAFPHQTTIASETGLGRDVVAASVARLETLKIISSKRTRKGNIYAFEKSAFATWQYATRRNAISSIATSECRERQHSNVGKGNIGMSEKPAQELHQGTTPENHTREQHQDGAATPLASGHILKDEEQATGSNLAISDPLQGETLQAPTTPPSSQISSLESNSARRLPILGTSRPRGQVVG